MDIDKRLKIGRLLVDLSNVSPETGERVPLNFAICWRKKDHVGFTVLFTWMRGFGFNNW
jgi:hypothetical protein